MVIQIESTEIQEYSIWCLGFFRNTNNLKPLVNISEDRTDTGGYLHHQSVV